MWDTRALYGRMAIGCLLVVVWPRPLCPSMSGSEPYADRRFNAETKGGEPFDSWRALDVKAALAEA